MKSLVSFLIVYFLLLIASASFGQKQSEKKVVLTGARFTYPLLQKWIKDYKEANPTVEVLIESRSSNDPKHYDLLIEAYELDKDVQEEREVLSIGRYALLPIANSKSALAQTLVEKGLTKDLISQLFFHDIYAGNEKHKDLNYPHTIYTRLQKAGAPLTFANYFGYEQQNINGKSIAGGDEHLIAALLKDSTGVSYNNLGLIYDLNNRQVIKGITVLPVDANDNGRVSKDEHFYSDLDQVIEKLEGEEIKNVPLGYFNISIKKLGYNTEALKFLFWVIYNGQDDLHQYGFLKPSLRRFENEKQKFEQLASK
jgi:ABC-type phosphate transport system substrate-binding protein